MVMLRFLVFPAIGLLFIARLKLLEHMQFVKIKVQKMSEQQSKYTLSTRLHLLVFECYN